jgi:hypothetical protein
LPEAIDAPAVTGTMQTRPYDEKDGLRIWLNRDERATLLEAVDDPRRRIALTKRCWQKYSENHDRLMNSSR